MHSLALMVMLALPSGSLDCCVVGVELEAGVIGRRSSHCMPPLVRVRMNFDEELRRSAELL